MNESCLSSKVFWQKFGITVSLIFFLVGTLFLMNFLSRKFFNAGIKISVENLLREKEDVEWIIGNPVYLNSTFDSRACLFEMREKNNVEKNYVLVIRVATLFGHMPAVFIYNKQTGTRFVGYASVKGKVRRLLDKACTDSSMNYWADKVPQIIKYAEEGLK